jgi:hypothetical protein
MIDSDDLYGPMEVGDDLSTTLGTETLADRAMVPPSFDSTPGSSADALPIEAFEHRRFLRAARSIKKLITPGRNTLADDVWVSEGVVGSRPYWRVT